MTKQRSLHRGFGIVELFVVMGLLLVIFALAFPSIQAALGASQRIACQARLQGLALAAANHQSVYGYFPYNCFGPDEHVANNPNVLRCKTAFEMMLPFIDQNPVFDMLNHTATPITNNFPGIGTCCVNAPILENTTAACVAIAQFTCPSEPSGRPTQWSALSYRCNLGRAAFTSDANGPFFDYEAAGGAFSLVRRPHRPSDFPDGLSATAIFSEKPIGFVGSNPAGAAFDGWVGVTYSFMDFYSADELVRLCGAEGTEGRLFNNLTGQSWAVPNIEAMAYTHDAGPNSQVADCFGSGPYASLAARSYHSQLVNVAMADGSVRAVHQSIAHSIWRATGTRNGSDNLEAE